MHALTRLSSLTSRRLTKGANPRTRLSSQAGFAPRRQVVLHERAKVQHLPRLARLAHRFNQPDRHQIWTKCEAMPNEKPKEISQTTKAQAQRRMVAELRVNSGQLGVTSGQLGVN